MTLTIDTDSPAVSRLGHLRDTACMRPTHRNSHSPHNTRGDASNGESVTVASGFLHDEGSAR